MGKRKRREKPRQGKRSQGKTSMPWVEFRRENDLFEQYYKVQQMVPEEEFAVFIEAMQRELPSTFRITGTRSHAQELLNAIKKFFLDDLQNIQFDGEKANPPTPIAWYPDELAWQINLTKKFIRKSSCMGKFHNFLVHETETGNISRQEAVSMIPPLLLDVKPGQKILDACAAPGSKTVQLIELLHDEESSQVPDGLVVANELQNKRCYMLVHQSKRLHSPCCLITNHDAALFPTLFVKGEDDKKAPLIFDRILCDVPCSGDGTLRKNPIIWRKWNPQLGFSLFRIQLRILARAVEMLSTGGRIVYSTCTLNPVEDEAVICTILQKAEGAMELVDVSSYLPNLKRSPGLRTWKVMSKDMKIVDNCDPGTEYYSKGFKPEMLAPSDEVVNKVHLERCMRIYPHQQDTGGFFIAVLKKNYSAPWENDKRCSNNPRLLPWESMTDWQKRKEEKCKKVVTSVTRLPTADEMLDKNECKSEEETTADTCVEDIGNQDATTVDDDDDDLATGSNLHHDEDDEQQSSSENVELDLPPHNKSAINNDVIGDDIGEPGQPVQPPRKKAKVEMKGYKEEPFVFLKEEDEHWPLIKKFYGIGESFPANQLMVRSVAGKKRNIYLVSKAVKKVMEMIDDNHKVVNTGMKVFARAEADNVGCDFRLMQEGIEVMLPFISKRKVMITQRDVVILLTHDRPYINEFSSGTQEQLNNIEEQGCVVYIYEPNGTYSSPEDTIGCRIVFCGWRAKVSTRVQISKFDKAHYQVLCGIPPAEKQKGIKSTLKPEKDAVCKKDEVTQPNEDAQQTGSPGDILNLEVPEGSLDVGFI